MALPPNGNGTDRAELLQDLLDAGAITLDSFTANPQTVPPCGGTPVTLTWQIARHPERVNPDLRRIHGQISYVLNISGAQIDIAVVGSYAFRPWITTSYAISAGINAPGGRRLSRLGSVVVNVSETGCLNTVIPEATIRSMVQSVIQTFLDQNVPDVRLRNPVGQEADVNGVSLTLRLAS